MENQGKTRKLPVFKIEGTDFYVDIRLNEFREVNAPWNTISLDELNLGTETVTGLVYNTQTKNIYEEIIDEKNKPEYVKLVMVPPLSILDPVGFARINGIREDNRNRQQFSHKSGKGI